MRQLELIRRGPLGSTDHSFDISSNGPERPLKKDNGNMVVINLNLVASQRVPIELFFSTFSLLGPQLCHFSDSLMQYFVESFRVLLRNHITLPIFSNRFDYLCQFLREAGKNGFIRPKSKFEF